MQTFGDFLKGNIEDRVFVDMGNDPDTIPLKGHRYMVNYIIAEDDIIYFRVCYEKTLSKK